MSIIPEMHSYMMRRFMGESDTDIGDLRDDLEQQVRTRQEQSSQALENELKNAQTQLLADENRHRDLTRILSELEHLQQTLTTSVDTHQAVLDQKIEKCKETGSNLKKVNDISSTDDKTRFLSGFTVTSFSLGGGK